MRIGRCQLVQTACGVNTGSVLKIRRTNPRNPMSDESTTPTVVTCALNAPTRGSLSHRRDEEYLRKLRALKMK
jgi:hypothetical protein